MAALAVIFWVRYQAVNLSGIQERVQNIAARGGFDAATLKAQIEAANTFTIDDGRRFLYPTGFDSYIWLRAARSYLETQTSCDEVRDGSCRTTYSHAPVGREHEYGQSLHVRALAENHRWATKFDPALPLTATAPWLSIWVALLGAIATFAIGRRLAGNLAGFVAAILVMMHPDLLWRSVGADNDIWNITLPLWAAWMAVEAASAPTKARAIGFAAIAGFVTGLHAWAWSGWLLGFVILSGGLGAHAALNILRGWMGSEASAGESAEPSAAEPAHFAVAATFVASALVFGGLFGSWESVFALPQELFATVLERLGGDTGSPSSASIFHPNAFATVNELRSTGQLLDASLLGGPAYFFLAWLGLLLLLLPPDRFESWHWGLIVAANILFRTVWYTSSLSPTAYALALFGPLALVLAGITWMDRKSARYLNAAGLVVIVWFLAAAVISREGLRFRMLLAPPFALAAGVFFGRLYVWGRDLLQPWLSRMVGPELPPKVGPRTRNRRRRLLAGVAATPLVARALVVVVALVLLVEPVRGGVRSMRGAFPQVNTGWVTLLENLSKETPPDTIVNTWWDFGYWIQYFANRRTTNDGGSLGSGIPVWMARAFLAPSDAEAAGLLRMLNCGSAVSSGKEAEASALYRLVKAGVHPSRAPSLLHEIVRLKREQAAAELASLGLASKDAEDVLAASHCTPPPSVLVLTGNLLGSDGWRYLGNWDYRRAYLANHAVDLPDSEAMELLTEEFDYEPSVAAALLEQARAIPADQREARFVTDRGGYVKPGWSPCAAEAQGWRCEVGGPSRSGLWVESVSFQNRHAEDFGAVRVRLLQAGQPIEVEPARVIVANGAELETISDQASSGTLPEPEGGLAVLLDTVRGQVLVGTPAVLSGTYTRLFFLDEIYSPSFRRIDNRFAPSGERLVVWTQLQN